MVEVVWVVVRGIALAGVDEQDGVPQMTAAASGHPHRLQTSMRDIGITGLQEVLQT